MQLIIGSLAAMCVVLVACGANARQDAEDSFAHLAVEPTQSSAGGQVTLTLMNRSEQALGYNLCPVAIERLVGDAWEERSERPAEFCTMELRVLDPGASATYEHTVPSLPPGTYRFRASVERPLGGEQAAVVSEQFEVSA